MAFGNTGISTSLLSQVKSSLCELSTFHRILQHLAASLRILIIHVQKEVTVVRNNCIFFSVDTFCTTEMPLMIVLLLEALWFTVPLNTDEKKIKPIQQYNSL